MNNGTILLIAIFVITIFVYGHTNTPLPLEDMKICEYLRSYEAKSSTEKERVNHIKNHFGWKCGFEPNKYFCPMHMGRPKAGKYEYLKHKCLGTYEYACGFGKGKVINLETMRPNYGVKYCEAPLIPEFHIEGNKVIWH